MASVSRLTAGILIISDTAAEDNSTDRCGPILRDVFAAEDRTKWDVKTVDIVPDDANKIVAFIKEHSDCEDFTNLIITSGGTGFSRKDSTPEV
jgi:gephyrin